MAQKRLREIFREFPEKNHRKPDNILKKIRKQNLKKIKNANRNQRIERGRKFKTIHEKTTKVPEQIKEN